MRERVANQSLVQLAVVRSLSWVRLCCEPWTVCSPPGKIIGAGCHFFLQGIVLSQGLNPGLRVSCSAGGFFTPEPPVKPAAGCTLVKNLA